MAEEPLKIGFIGSGGLAKHHMGQVTRNGKAVVAAISDVYAYAMKDPAERYGARTYSNHRDMLESETLDAVYVAVPPFAHGDIERDLCRAKLPFFVQKPVAKDMEIAREIEGLVRDAGIVTCVGYQLRYLPTAQRLKRILADKKVGMGAGRYWCGFTQEVTRGWLIQKEMSGGQIIEQTTHLLDMIRFLAGEITEVYGYETKMLAGGGDCPDANAALLKLASGGAVTITSSWGTGSAGDWSQANRLQLFWDLYRADWSPDSLELSPKFAFEEEAPEPGREIDDAFLEAVRTGDGSAILSPYAEGVKSLAVSVAIDRSSETGNPVKTSEV
jgi:predicted dehydrogenase